MTCIVGLVEDGVVYMGGESAMTGDTELWLIREPKVFRKGDLLIGCSGSSRFLQLVRYKFDPGEIDKDNLMEWMVTTFVDRLRECLVDGRFVKDELIDNLNGNLMIGVRGCLFELTGEYEVNQNREPYSVLGSGRNYARGSMYATDDSIVERKAMLPYDRVFLAVNAACEFDAHCRPPINVYRSDQPQNKA